MAATACEPLEPGPRFRAAGATVPRNGGTLRFAVTDQLATLDPTKGYDEVAYIAMHPLFDTLVDFTPGGFDVMPRLAESWQVSPDGLVYTFALRRDITFSDGAPIVAAHFKYSLERALTPAGSQYVDFLHDVDGADDVIEKRSASCKGIIAAGDHVLVIRLARRNPALLEMLALPFATPQRPEHVTAAGDQLRRTPDATGPFMLERWDEGRELVLRRNPHYHDASRAHLDAIDMRDNVPRDVQLQMFERGELDVAGKLAAPDYLYILAAPAWAPYIQRSVGLNAYGSRMNVQKPPFTDRRVRQALNYALDKSHTARLLSGATSPSHGILPPGMLGRDPDLPPYPHDVARARALLAEAGYPDGFDVDYLTSNDDESETVATSLQSDLAEAGVRVHLQVTTFSAYESALGLPDPPAFSYGSWLGDYPDPINFFELPFRSPRAPTTEISSHDTTSHDTTSNDTSSNDSSSNNTHYASPALDALLDEARAETAPDRRAALYRRAERILYDDAPWIWDYHRVDIAVVQPYVRDYVSHPIWRRDVTSAWLDVGDDGAPVPAAGPAPRPR